MTDGTYRAAAVQFEPVLGDKRTNMARTLDLTAEAAERDAKLIVLPEMATTGYCWTSREEVAPFVETIPGPTTDRFAALAAATSTWIVVGLPELDGTTGGFYNTAALIGPKGLVGRYRKTHPYITEVRWALDGDLGLPIFDTELGRIGMLICMDAEYPEPARVLALAGCDVVCFPTNWLTEHAPSGYWLQRAYENGTYWVASNRIGLERGVQFSGGSAVIGPDGAVLDLVDAAEGVAIAEIDLARARRCRRDRLCARRPELYHEAVLNSYLWPNVHRDLLDDAGALDGIGSPIEPLAISMAVLSPVPGRGDVLDRAHGLLGERPADITVLSALALPGGGVSLADALGEGAAVLLTLEALAAQHNVMIVGSVPMREDGATFDAVVLQHPNGERVVHRNTHPADKPWATAGGVPPPVCRTPYGLLGLLCGDELLSPEPLRGLSASGAEFTAAVGDLREPAPVGLGATDVPLPDPSPTGADPRHWLLPRVRAAENNVWLAFANAGTLPSGIFGPSFYRFPRREMIADDGVARMDLPADLDDRDRRTALEKPYLRMRVPHLYPSLIASAQPAVKQEGGP
jgi:predicted amidohydrolase